MINTQMPEVKGTLVAGNHEPPAIKLATLNLDASVGFVITR